MTANKFETLMRQGFRSVIVNCPDQEQDNLVSVNQLGNIAEQVHVSFIYQQIINR